MSDIRAFLKESVSAEYRAKYSPRIGNTICAFLNTIGGTIVLGIDERGTVSQSNEIVVYEISSILNRISPDPQKYVEIKKDNVLGKECIVISVTRPINSDELYSLYGTIYYRRGANNHIIDIEKGGLDFLQNNRRKANNLPVLEEYSPSDTDKSENFDVEKKNHKVSYKRIGPLYQNRSTFYKYLDLDTVLMIFRENPKFQEGVDKKEKQFLQTMRFVEPPKWEDQFESRFYNANYKKVNKDPNNIPKLYATCFTPKEESEPAWMAYNKDKSGLAKRCVQFRINQIKLREELVKNLENSSKCTIVEGSVQYKSKETIRTLHLSTDKDNKHSEIYDEYFSDFTLANYIQLLLLKRIAYEHEREVRIFLIYDDDKLKKKGEKKEDHSYKDIKLNWLSMLERIRVSPDCTQTEIDLLQDEINNLIDKSSEPDKEGLKKKLEVKKYNVNEDEDRDGPLPIGETYEEFQERMDAKKANP